MERSKQVNYLSISSKNNINLSSTMCISQIMPIKHHKYTIINNEQVPLVEIIYLGAIMLNQFKVSVKIAKAKSYELSGTYLI